MVFATYFFLMSKKMEIENTIAYIINQIMLGLASEVINSSFTPKYFNGPLLSYSWKICNEKNVIGNNMTIEKNIETFFMLKNDKVRLHQFYILF